MTFTTLIFFILSNAMAISKKTSIQYSRSTLVSTFYCILFIYFTMDWYFFTNSISLYNGLLYTSTHTLLFIFFLYLLEFLILTLTSFFPYNIISEHLSTSIPSISAGKQTESLETIPLQGEDVTIKKFLQTNREHYSILEYPLITIFVLIGGITLLSSNDLITMFLSLELQSYGLYILSTIYRNSESSTSAGLTYFLLGGLSSCIILLGQSLLYVNLGTTHLDGIYIIHNIFNSDPNLFTFFLAETMSQEINGYVSTYVPFSSILSIHFYQYSIQLAFIIIAIGFLFKISASPFHSWSPGVYDAIPTVTTTFVAIIAKISIFILLFDLVYCTGYTTLDYSWKNVLLFSSFLSLIVGSVLGLSQFRIKRLYAYSTISHVGFILLALSIHSVESVQAFFFYIIQYSLSNLNAFIILVAIGYTYTNYIEKKKNYKLLVSNNTTELSSIQQKGLLRSKESNKTDSSNSIQNRSNINAFTSNKVAVQSILHDYKEKINNLSPIEYIDQLKGYFYLNPVLAISLSVTLYSFIGVPPLVGFFAKQMILSSALDNGYIFMCLIAILTSVISAVYYLYIIKHMFFEKSEYVFNKGLNSIIKNQLTNVFSANINKEKKEIKSIALSSWLTCVISILSLIMLLFIFLYHETYFLMNIISILIIY